jgi:hypothetical protein
MTQSVPSRSSLPLTLIPHGGISFQVARDLWLNLKAEKEIEHFNEGFQDRAKRSARSRGLEPSGPRPSSVGLPSPLRVSALFLGGHRALTRFQSKSAAARGFLT